jgi:hypothetical protein
MDTDKQILSIRPPKPMVVMGAIFLGVASIYLLVSLKSTWRADTDGQQIPSVSVSGEGKVTIKPDIATFSIGVVKTSKDLGAAQKEAADIMTKATALLKEKGVAEKDIKTTAYNIYPQYDWRQSGRVFLGYEVRQTAEVKVRDLAKVGEILGAMGSVGANEIGSLAFSIDKPEQAKEEARTKAIADAKVKANRLSKDLGVRLKKIISYSESNGGGYPGPIYMKTMSEGMGGDAMPPISGGENEILVNVSITYEIQ